MTLGDDPNFEIIVDTPTYARMIPIFVTGIKK